MGRGLLKSIRIVNTLVCFFSWLSRRRKFDEDLHKMLWKINLEDIDFKPKDFGSVR